MSKTKFLHNIASFIGIVIFLIALWVLHSELKTYHFHDIIRSTRALPRSQVYLAFLLTVLSYIVMTGYDALALRYIKQPLSYNKTAFASFVSYAFSNNIGISMLAGGSVRFRLYSAWGLSPFDITRVVFFCALTLWLGFLTLAGIIFIINPTPVSLPIPLPFSSVQILGIIALCPVVAFFCFCMFRTQPIKIRGWELIIPSPKLLSAQIAVAVLDWFIAGSILYVLLPISTQLSFWEILKVFLLGQLIGLISQIPGGVGIFETVTIFCLSSKISASAIFGSLLVYRGMYYILPLLIAAILLGTQEILQKKERIQRIISLLGPWVSEFIPHIFGFITFVGGAILLFSGATPGVSWRFIWLKKFVPLPVIESSHFLGSIVGMCLLVLARGLQRRIDAAYLLVSILLGAGIIFSLLKGLDYEEAIILTLMLIALLPCRRYFYRKASLLNEGFTSGWLGAIILVLLCTIVLVFFSYKHISDDLWWKFTFSGHASRSLRGLVGAIGVGFFIALVRLLQPAPQKLKFTLTEEQEMVASIIRNSPCTYAFLALLKDKKFLFNDKRNAFIMYNISGRSWISMGDPVGPDSEARELIWRFREMCDRYDGWAVFYEVGVKNIPIYIDLGLSLLKIGEEGRVWLPDFSLKGNARKGFRNTLNKLEKSGYLFKIISSEQVPAFLPELRKISNDWLKGKNTREKGFSLGFFDEDYLKQFPVALVQKEGEIVAFANIWAGAGKEELSLDLMRHLTDVPNGIIDYLFLKLMLWGKEEGYKWFNLGMTPLAGIEEHNLAPLWSRLGSLIFTYGEYFYNFQGIRQYKQKFDPQWEPKYIAFSSGLALPRILIHIASLISRGMKGVITK